MKLDVDNKSNMLLFLLLSADVLLIILNILYLSSERIGFFRTPWLSFDDRSFPESYTYIKEFWIVLLLAILAVRRSKSLYFFWSLLYGYLLVDDSFRFHERLGSLLNFHFKFIPVFGLRPQDIGELTVYGISAVFLLIPIGIAYSKSDADTKLDSRCFFIILAILAFFGVGVDMVHEMITNITLNESFGVLENGGEMLVVSIMLWFAFCLVTNDRCRLNICDKLHSRSSCWLMRYLGRFICVKF
jgi:hypothetical protein